MCIIDYKNRLIYIAVPKTASQSTETFFNKHLNNNSCCCLGCSHDYSSKKPEPDIVHDLGLSPHIGGIKPVFLKTPSGISKYRIYKHSTAAEIKKAIPEYDLFKKVSVVRNPFDWYVSLYCYQEREDWSVKHGKFSFPDWLQRTATYRNQEIINWFIDDNRKIIVDEIIEYNNLETGLFNFLKKCKINFKDNLNFPKINVSVHRNNTKYHKFYNKKTKKIVENHQSNTINYFKYNFYLM
jgi:hypothetical protein